MAKALRANLIAGEALPRGERNGAVMGEMSLATDAARAALERAEGFGL